MDRVTVLMSTYNGEKYLSQQLDSILNQKNVEVIIHIRDDGSSDNTINILHEYSSSHPNVEYYQGKNLRPCKSFMELMTTEYEGDYFALADQDDVWDHDKLFKAIELIKKKGRETVPVLYYSNLRIVDSELNFCRNSHSKPLVSNYKYEPLVENLVTGCTVVYNKKMQEVLLSHKVNDFSMHDTWLYMIAAVFGMTIYDFEPHISYRQHDNNVIGTYKKGKNIGFYFDKVKRMFDRDLQPRYNNAKIFYKAFKNELPVDYKKKLLEIIKYKSSVKSKVRLLLDNDIRANSTEANIRLRIVILSGVL